MTLRILATLSLLLGAGALLTFLHLLGKGPFAARAERHLRAMKDRAIAPAAAQPLTISEMGDLPRSRPLAEYSVVERRGVRVEGYVQRILRATDGDFHLSLSPLRTHMGDRRGFANATAEVTPQWARRSSAWSYERLAEVFRPLRGSTTDWEGGPRRVRLSGWLMYDYPSEGAVPEDLYSIPAVSAWEIHPVTRIEFWNDSLGTFMEYPR